jgi:hypothetical protein
MIEINLKNKSTTPLVYWLNTEDIQGVAMEKLGRLLTNEEIEKIIEPISENIDWNEAICTAIIDHIELH